MGGCCVQTPPGNLHLGNNEMLAVGLFVDVMMRKQHVCSVAGEGQAPRGATFV